LGIPKSGIYASSAPATVTALCDTVTVTGIKNAAHATGITGAVHIDDVVTSTGTASVVAGLTPLSCVTSVAATTYTVLSSSGGTVSVYQAGSGDENKFLTAPASAMSGSELKVVACPTSDLCPPED
jgi:hypothetical protein